MIKVIARHIKLILKKSTLMNRWYKPEYRFIPISRFIQYSLFQRVFRINSRVPWPCHWSSVVSDVENIKFLGDICPLGFSPGCYVQALNGIVVGANVIHAAGVKILSADHDVLDFSKHIKSGPIKIGSNCWLGANVTVLPEVELGDHTIVAAGAVVTKSFPEGNMIVGGVPARVIKKIGDYKSS